MLKLALEGGIEIIAPHVRRAPTVTKQQHINSDSKIQNAQ